MEQLLYLLISLTASSSIILAGNDTNILTSTTPLPNTTTLSQQTKDPTTVQLSTEKSVTFTSHSDHVMVSHSFETASTTTAAPSSFNHTAGTTVVHGENRSGQTNITSSPITRSESYTEAPQHVSYSVATITVSEYSTPVVHLNTTDVTEPPAQMSGDSLTTLAFGVMSLILILIVVMVILVTTINLRGRCRSTKQQEDIKNYDSMVSDSNMTNNCEKESITLVSVRTINTDYDTDSPQVSSVRSTIVDNEDQELNRDLLSIKGGL